MLTLNRLNLGTNEGKMDYMEEEDEGQTTKKLAGSGVTRSVPLNPLQASRRIYGTMGTNPRSTTLALPPKPFNPALIPSLRPALTSHSHLPQLSSPILHLPLSLVHIQDTSRLTLEPHRLRDLPSTLPKDLFAPLHQLVMLLSLPRTASLCERKDRNQLPSPLPRLLFDPQYL